MNLSACYYLGYISRVMEAKKQCVFKLDVDHPENYLKLESVLIQLRKADENPVPFFIRQVAGLRKDKLTVELQYEGLLPDPNVLKGCSLFLPLSSLPPKGKQDYYFHEIIGFTVEDEKLGKIGVIADVYDLAVHPVLSIDHKGREVLIPLHDETFLEVDRANRLFKVRTPEGLMDIYLE